MIIALSGYAKSGKDTVADIIRSLDSSVKVVRFSDPLKQVAEVLTGIPAARWNSQNIKDGMIPGWNMTGREFLQRLGTEAIRNNFDKDTWVRALFSKYKQGDRWVITDCRFQNEAVWVKMFGGKLIRIERPGVDPTNDHVSETELDSWKFDHTIHNNGTLEDLRKTVIEFYEGRA